MGADYSLLRRNRSTLPEFTDAKGMTTLFSISRTQAYELAKQGKIRTVCLRKKGAEKGKRLFDCQSVRKFLLAHYDDAILKEEAR
jgi:hypothetical protein